MSNDIKSESVSFHIEEYKLLRKEILERLRYLDQLEKISIFGAGAIYAWLASIDFCKLQYPFYAYAAWIPSIIFLLVGLRSSYIMNKVIFIGNYIREIELNFRNENLDGWENRIFRHRDGETYKEDRIKPLYALRDNFYILIYYGAIAVLTAVVSWKINKTEISCALSVI